MEEPRHKRSYIVGFHLYEMLRISKPIETSEKLEVDRGRGGWESN